MLRARFAFPSCPVVKATCTAHDRFLKHASMCCWLHLLEWLAPWFLNSLHALLWAAE